MRWLKLLLQRCLVLALGAVTVWLIAFVVFDVANRRLPLAFAVAVTYAVAAYIVLPRAIRLALRILQRGHVPSYTITGDGLPGDPVNLALVGTMHQLQHAFAAAGWSQADQLNLVSSWRMVRAFVLGHPYPTAPFSTLYLFGRGQDVGFQLPIGNSPRRRHHVRFWGLPLDHVDKTIDTPSFWSDTLRPGNDERVVWIGAGTKDIGFSLTRLSFQITHATDAETDDEREFVIGELQRCGVITKIRSHRPGERNAIGKVNHYLTDGAVAVAELGPANDAADQS